MIRPYFHIHRNNLFATYVARALCWLINATMNESALNWEKNEATLDSWRKVHVESRMWQMYSEFAVFFILMTFPRISNDWTMTKANITTKTAVVDCVHGSRINLFVLILLFISVVKESWQNYFFSALSGVVLTKLEHIQIQKVSQTKRHYDYNVHSSFIDRELDECVKWGRLWYFLLKILM